MLSDSKIPQFCGKVIDVAFSCCPSWYYHYNMKFQCSTRDNFLRTSWLSATEHVDKCTNKKLEVLFFENGIQKIFRLCFCFLQTSWLGICSKISFACLIIHSYCWQPDHCPLPILSRICCYGGEDKDLLWLSDDNLVSVTLCLFRKQRGILKEHIPSNPPEFF